MKKFISFVLSCLLVFGTICPALADEAESETVEKLILIAKEKLSIDDETMKFANYYRSESRDGLVLYTLDWESKDENTYKNIHASMHESGVIYSYSSYEDKGKIKPSFPKHTVEEAQETARVFIESIDPQKLSYTGAAEAERSYDNNYAVTFPRVHNGIPVAQNFLRCMVDSTTLKVTEYYASWQENLHFKKEEPITREEAVAAFCEHLGYEPFYHVISRDYENSVKLVYRSPYDENVMIDALTGEPTTLADRQSAEEGLNEKAALSADTASGSGAANRAQLSPQEKELLDKVSAMLSKEKADAISRAVPEYGITEAYSLENHTISRQQDGTYSIGLSYRMQEGEEYSYKSLQLDAATGQITSYYSGGYKPLRAGEAVKEMPSEALKEKAIDFMEKYYAEAFGHMTEKTYFTQNHAAFTFLRQEDGIKVYNNGAQLSYDAKTGELSSFSIDWTDVAFPEITEKKSIAEANKKAMETGKFQLLYMPIHVGEGQYSAEPVYTLQTRPVLSALTLESLNYNLEPVAEEKTPVYTDISGHYAEERIQKLLNYGVFLNCDEHGRVFPNEHITQLDYFMLLDDVIWQRGYDSDIEALYRYLIRQNILTKEEVTPDAPVSRLQAVTYLLRALGYGDFIKIPDIFVNRFQDVPQEAAGTVAVAYGLRLIAGDGAGFYPDAMLSKAYAMIIMYNYLQ
ncbi:MAG: hypothetical protein IKL80_01430 [Clostridia bacterium]|nr:hypothetical protein [Clostridia bacterium]